MKPSKILVNLKTQLLTNYIGEAYANAITTISIVGMLAAIIWIAGPAVTWHGFAPFALENQRWYAIVSLFLLCLLKVLLLDLDASSQPEAIDPLLHKKLQGLKNRFDGAIAFLKKTTTKHDKALALDELPWFLLIGPNHAGKTSMLANSQINYILQRQFPDQDLQHLGPSEHCDWWLTRNAAIIDVPSRYLAVHPTSKKAIVWDYFLNLIKTERGEKAIAGIVIALPLPDIMQDPDTKHYQQLQHTLLKRIQEIRAQFPHPLTCYVVITKCDKVPGFTEFFGEAGSDEVAQAWGITLSTLKNNGSRYDAFMHQLNALIKKLNQQLLWRLHHERNPLVRPAIKDFPLQIERMKEVMMNFIKKLASNKSGVVLQGVYFTSALQPTHKATNVIDESLYSDQQAVQLFKEPTSTTRAYFLKQFLNQGIAQPQIVQYKPDVFYKWKLRAAYAASAMIIGAAAIVLGKDFAEGIKETYTVQNHFTDYQLGTLQIQDPIVHLEKTLTLLNELQLAANDTGFKLDLKHVMSFYSHKSQEKAGEIYQQALHNVLLPEVKIYFEEFLDNPVNKNSEYVYETLKAYLMLGDASRYDATFVMKTFEETLPATFTQEQLQQLTAHLKLALHQWTPMPLNAATVFDTRKFLLAMPTIQLSYIILKNIDNNNALANINLGVTENVAAFINRQPITPFTTMFTGKAFMSILSQEINYAASEAVTGNWVLSDGNAINTNPTVTAALVDQLRLTYVTNYINTWEGALNNLDLSAPTNLVQTDQLIVNLISNNSPMLQLLKTLHENTYFEPLLTASPKLQAVGALIEHNRTPESQLYQVFAALQNLHVYVQSILSAGNEKKAAFEAISTLSQNLSKTGNAPDSITQLRMIAAQSPEPVKTWLNKIANTTWRFLLQDASRYLDTSWKEQVGQFYDTEIVDHYPFNLRAENEIELKKFSQFFGNPGIIPSFFNNYLQAFVDTSTPTWRFKSINNEKLPFSDDALRQIQQAMRIHELFFPNNDNAVSVQFALQPYKFDAKIRKVKLSINDKQITDEKAGPQAPHMLTWPVSGKQATSIQLTLSNNQTLGRTFTGEWSWFKLLNQSFESMVSKKEVIINLSVNDNSAKYLVFTQGQVNPLFSLNLSHFQLAPTLLTEKV